MTEAMINIQALLVKSYLLNALLMNRKAVPIGYHGAQVLRPASRYSARLNAVRRDCLLWEGSCGDRRQSGASRRMRRSTPNIGGCRVGFPDRVDGGGNAGFYSDFHHPSFLMFTVAQ